MATVDDRVVAMSFENDRFNSGAESTIGVLGRLKAALNLSGAAQGLNEIDAAGSRIDLSHIGQAAEGIAGSFSVLGGAAAVALGNIATKAVEVGAEVIKSLTLDPIMEGFHNYETQINAVQTIMANTGLSGASGLSQVNAVLKDMQNYANLTVYNFSEMAKSIGTFTAAGVQLKTAQESIKGIANLAALSGSSSDQASSAMYQLSQAIAAGKVQLQDWNSVVNAGIGGKVLQEALFNTGKAMGTLKDVPLGESFDQWTKAGNSFRQSLQRGSQAAQQAQSPIEKLAQAHKDAAQAITDAQRSAADAVTAAAQRVKDAQRSVGDAVRQAAQSVQTATDSVTSAQQAASDGIRQAAKDIQNAMDGVSQSQQNLANVNRTATKDIADAVQQEHQTVITSAQNVQNALDAVVVARQKLADAMKPPSADEIQAAQDKLTTARLDQAGLADAVTLAQEQQTRATQDLGIAQDNLNKLLASGTATPDQIIMGQRAVQDAQQKVKDLTDAQTRALLAQHAAARSVDQAQTDLQTTQEKGTKADKNVQTAQDALTKALTAYHDAQIKSAHDITSAEQNVKDVRIRSAQAQQAAETALTKAEQNLSDVRIKTAENEQKAQEAIVKAEQNLSNVRISSAESVKKSQEQLAQAEHDQAQTAITSAESVAKAHEQAAKQIQAAEQAAQPKGQGANTWLTSGVLVNTLKQFSGDMTTAQLKAQGFTDAQIAHIEAMGKTAVNSATQVKTFSQLMQSLKEEVGTAWGSIFTTIFGNIDQAKSLFSPLHTTIENALTNPLYAANNILKDWAQAGGRTALIDALKTAWEDLTKVLHVVRQAWLDVFPTTSGNSLADMTKSFDEFMHRLTPSKQTLEEIGRTFKGLFAVLDIGKTIIMDVVHIFEHLFGVVAPSAGGGFLSLTARIGDFLVKVDDMVKKGTSLTGFFSALGGVLSSPVHLFERLGNVLPSLSTISNDLQKAWDKLTGSFGRANGALSPLAAGLVSVFHSITTFLGQSLQNMNFDQLLHTIDVGLLGGIFLLFKRFFTGAKLTDLVGGGIFKSVKETIEGVTGSLKAMQRDLQAHALLQIAIAIGVLAASLLVLSTIPSNKLDSASTAMAIMMTQLAIFMKTLDKLEGGVIGAVKLGVLAGGMILLAGAIGLLAISVKELADLNWQQLERGLSAVGVLLAEISLAMGPISRNSAGMISAGLGIIALAEGIKILAEAVAKFGNLNWTQLEKGLVAVAASLVAIGAASRLFPSGMVALGLGLIGVSEGIKLLVGSVVRFSEMNINDIAKGLFGIAGALGVLALGMHSMPPGLAFQAAGLLVMAEAIRVMGSALRNIGTLDGSAILRGLVGLGGALGILAVAITAMDGALPGAIALGVISSSLMLLAPALRILGDMSAGNIIASLAALGGALAVLGVGTNLLAPTVPVMLAFGGALLAIGGGLALAGAGIALVGVGLSAIAVSGPAAIAIIIHSLESFFQAIPKFIEGAVTGILGIVTALAKAAPQLVTGIGQILDSLGKAVILAVPVIAQAFEVLVVNAIGIIRKNFPLILQTGMELLLNLLAGIQKNIGSVVTHVAGIITTFLGALAKHVPEIVAAGANMLVKFLSGIAGNIAKVAAGAVSVIAHFIDGVANSIGKVVAAGANLIIKFVAAIASASLRMFNTGISIISNFLLGIARMVPRIVSDAANIIAVFITSVAKAALKLIDVGAETIINFLNGVATAIRKYEPQLWDAGWNIVSAMIDGMVNGVLHLGQHLLDKIGGLFSGLPSVAKHLLGIHSPSTVFHGIGENIVQGLADGIDANANRPVDAVQNLATGMIATVQSISSSISDAMNLTNPTITPVLDLSEIKKGANLIPGYLSAPQYSLPALSTGQSTPQGNSTGPGDTAKGTSVTFIQNNQSPQALNPTDIYRMTQNQLSQLAGSSLPNDAAFFAKGG